MVAITRNRNETMAKSLALMENLASTGKGSPAEILIKMRTSALIIG
jgi:hypothetical protein